MIVPHYLSSVVLEVQEIPDYENNQWFIRNDSKFKLMKGNNDLFKICFHGIQIQKHIVNYDDKPLVIYAEDKNNERYLLFDGRIHGFEALFIENLNTQDIGDLIYYKLNQNDKFKIYLWANYDSILSEDFSEENVELINGEVINKKNIIDISFDSFGIILENSDGNYISILEMELA